MHGKTEPDTNLRERKPFIPTEGGNYQGDRAVTRIKTILTNEKLVKSVAFLYRVVILVLLILVVAFVFFARKKIEQVARNLVAPAHCDPPCPRYWIGYEGKCYYFSKEKLNWASSQNFCSLHNASLIKIEIEEKEFLMCLKCKDTTWIGLQRRPGEPWTWSDGEMSVMEVTGGGTGDCAYLDNEGKVVSCGCHTKLMWICSKTAAYADREGATY